VVVLSRFDIFSPFTGVILFLCSCGVLWDACFRLSCFLLVASDTDFFAIQDTEGHILVLAGSAVE